MNDLARFASLLADPARARILTALMSGTALTATKLANEARIAPSTASSHLAKLTAARLLAIEKQGRHRYFRLFDEDIAGMLESLMGIATRPEPRMRRGPSDPAMRAARVCYDHLAGERGVWLFAQLRRRNVLEPSSHARTFFAAIGIDIDALTGARRPFMRTCLDWSERRPHAAGALGAAILDRVLTLRWARRELDSRAVTFSPSGERAFRAHFER